MCNGIQQKQCAGGPNLHKINFGQFPAVITKVYLPLVEPLTIIEFQMSLQSSYGEVGTTAKYKLKKVNSSNPDSEFMKLTKKLFQNAKDFQLDLTLPKISALK